MKYNPLGQQINRQEKGTEKSKTLPPRHHFAHSCVRSKLYDTLVSLACDNTSSVLDVGCGSGLSAIHIQKASENIVGVDISSTDLKTFTANGFLGILAEAEKLPFRSDSFDYVLCSGLLHHLVKHVDLAEVLIELARVTREGGTVIALEPNLFNLSGILMNTFNTIKPGITGLSPDERALSPLHLTRVFRRAGLRNVRYVSASYVWNRFPLASHNSYQDMKTQYELGNPLTYLDGG